MPLSDIKAKYDIAKIAFGDLVIEAMESKSGIIIDELPDEEWIEYIDIKDWLKNHPQDLGGIKVLMANETKIDDLDNVPF